MCMSELKPNTMRPADTHPAKRVLIAEDDPVLQSIYKELFSALPNVDVTVVADGKAAVSLCVVETFDLFVLDLNLPGLKGNKIISFIRTASPANSDKPIFLLSALPKEDLMKIKGVSMATRILSKPLNLDQFSVEIARVLT